MFSVRIISNSCSICSNRWCSRPFVLCNASDFEAPFRPRVPTAPRVSTRGLERRPVGGLDPLLTELVRDLSGAVGGRDMAVIVGQVDEASAKSQVGRDFSLLAHKLLSSSARLPFSHPSSFPATRVPQSLPEVSNPSYARANPTYSPIQSGIDSRIRFLPFVKA